MSEMEHQVGETILEGDIENVTIVEDGDADILSVSGWLIYAPQRSKKLEVGIHGSLMVEAKLVRRPDLQHSHPHIPHALFAGFEAKVRLSPGTCPQTVYVLLTLESGLAVAASFPCPGLESPRLTERKKDTEAVYDLQQLISLHTFLGQDSRVTFPYAAAPEVSVVLVTHNRADRTLACLISLARSVGVSFEVILVDNASTDRTEELLKRIDGVRVVRNTFNAHYLKGCVRGAAEARAPYLLMLNNDTVLFPQTMAIALATLKATPRAGAVGARLITPEGRIQEAGSIVWQSGATSAYGRGLSTNAPEVQFVREVDYCSAAFLLTHTDLFYVTGGFDETFAPAYFEDVDYCVRLRRQGLQVLYEPRALVLHAEHSSSENKQSALELQRRNRVAFHRKHQDFLETHTRSTRGQLGMRHAQRDKKHLLVLDDTVPLPERGSGLPRMKLILEALSQSFSVTFFPIQGAPFSWNEIYEVLPREIEVMRDHSAEKLEGFLLERAGFYDCIWASRPHAMELLSEILESSPGLRRDLSVIYDAEAFYSLRELSRIGLRTGAVDARDFECDKIIGQEVAYAQGAQAIVSVSQAEAQEFIGRNCANVHILSYGVATRPGPTSFAQRTGLLTVGPLHEEESPNTQALRWYLEEVVPFIKEYVEDATPHLSVIGKCSVTLPWMERAQDVSFLGVVRDLAPEYDRHRVFIAPTCFGAGIPLKVIEAAAAGLPVVCTTLVAQLLGWNHGVELMVADNELTFATYVLELYGNEELWQSLRRNALERVQKEYSLERFLQNLQGVLESVYEPQSMNYLTRPEVPGQR